MKLIARSESEAIEIARMLLLSEKCVIHSKDLHTLEQDSISIFLYHLINGIVINGEIESEKPGAIYCTCNKCLGLEKLFEEDESE